MSAALSILIPTYNYNAYPLVKALMTQIEGLSDSIEVLVYEDGSKVRSDDHDKINSLSQARYRFFHENRGRSSIRRSLAEDAGHQWLLFLDSDVMPGSESFLNNYLQFTISDYDVIFGGYSYEDDFREPDHMLRYRFGQERESANAAVRSQRPYLVYAGNLMIRKEHFLRLSAGIPDFYGEDLVLSDRIRKEKLKVKHIDNPIVHLGLEASKIYLDKVKEMASHVGALEKKGELSNDLMTLQTKYHWLRKRGMLSPLLWYVRTFENGIERNLLSPDPNLRNLDLIKLFHYHQSLKNG